MIQRQRKFASVNGSDPMISFCVVYYDFLCVYNYIVPFRLFGFICIFLVFCFHLGWNNDA